MDVYWEKAEIETAIRQKREQMIQSANTYGYTNEITLKHSQELDSLLNEYQRFFRQTENKGVLFSQRIKNALQQSPIKSFA